MRYRVGCAGMFVLGMDYGMDDADEAIVACEHGPAGCEVHDTLTGKWLGPSCWEDIEDAKARIAARPITPVPDRVKAPVDPCYANASRRKGASEGDARRDTLHEASWDALNIAQDLNFATHASDEAALRESVEAASKNAYALTAKLQGLVAEGPREALSSVPVEEEGP